MKSNVLDSAAVAVLRCCTDRLVRRSGQIVRGNPPPSGLSVRLREMVQVVPHVPAGVAVSPDHDCFFPNPGRMTAVDLNAWDLSRRIPMWSDLSLWVAS
jgi:hypothetical protein